MQYNAAAPVRWAGRVHIRAPWLAIVKCAGYNNMPTHCTHARTHTLLTWVRGGGGRWGAVGGKENFFFRAHTLHSLVYFLRTPNRPSLISAESIFSSKLNCFVYYFILFFTLSVSLCYLFSFPSVENRPSRWREQINIRDTTAKVTFLRSIRLSICVHVRSSHLEKKIQFILFRNKMFIGLVF